MVRQWDGRGESTLLSQLVIRDLNLHDPQELAGYVYGGDKSRVAAVSRLVLEAALAQDPAAERIYEKNGAELALLAAATARKLDMDHGKVALLGGQLVHDPLLRRAVKRCLLAGGLVGMACGELKNSGRKTGARTDNVVSVKRFRQWPQ